MTGHSLRVRAIAFALGAGALVFILALVATGAGITPDGAGRALIAATICGAMCWAFAEHTLAGTAAALDTAIQRLRQAADGDLTAPVPEQIDRAVPGLAQTMRELFDQVGSNLNSAERLALFDAVTGLPNRLHFRRTCDRLLETLSDDGSSALFFIDLDRFKLVNDTLGHASGDILLSMVAQRLRDVAGRFAGMADDGSAAHPLIGRLAGDEFTLFFPVVSDAADALRIGHGIHAELIQPFDVEGQDVRIGASVGVALRPRHGQMLAELMRAADMAMYRAKGDGRSRVALYTDEMALAAETRMQLERDLRDAVEHDAFSLYFQPQIAAKDGRVVGAEALLRWRHADGVRLPTEFIACAEETGLIVKIGNRVVDEVAETIARWARIGIEQRMAVNISPRQIDHATFFRRLRSALRAAGAPAGLLELEISETLAMTCSDDVISAIRALREDGATVAIDDFGTGYSNLARLRELPVDRVKLDTSIVEHVAVRTEARAIAQAVIGLIHGLGCTAVAEGIEDEAQRDVLRVIGCEVLQGYAIAPPMDEVTFMRWVAAQPSIRMPRPALRA
ncbi:bifunctional diguanylate cyclase/phosphodiesterase [Sphingomonas sp. BGYR3]|uniref:putative bifunctional diguanylate cyclase/phosphodiesterase n=1 Tax=Sphingomonas sp. BGYR3 TaxID=2975483 RepID=UPI0021A4159D|nr:bifunctional diguanylate cyclase/phosphodiesterase [Sphingomonas sp. BGYR3]MDG5489204.1 bifunctional diguanylate cyclase/phosphodiesterase [Sphingomonas sp. BGYR3]